MRKEDLEAKVNEGLSIRQLNQFFNCSYTTIRYWLNKYKLSTESNVIRNQTCKICNKNISNNTSNRSCCNTCITRLRKYRLKAAAVEYKGGKCNRCGYLKSLAALEFHHLDSSIKEFNIGGFVGAWAKIKIELDKCELICSNCHRVEHSSYDEEKFLIEARKSKLKVNKLV